QPLTARAPGRLFGFALAIAAACIAVYDATRGGWLGASILATAAIWLATSSQPSLPAPRRPMPPPPAPHRMSRADAASMRGVGPAANGAEMEAAYRRWMLRGHPDLGGAAGLAVQLNAARATMLGGEPPSDGVSPQR